MPHTPTATSRASAAGRGPSAAGTRSVLRATGAATPGRHCAATMALSGSAADREARMTFSEALATQPDWVRLWVLWMNVAVIGGALALLLHRDTRRDALVVLVANAAM